ncbi:hypothetical protein CYD53_103437 [Bosea psychrotolerans]|uniref:Uncharacterized protein n=1 Tax=Bosea psychrotolerans TaxID=1871628 RepID=A0A2S4MHV4_9HYPH|nr:hypothetical protein CYD53_103437 [Bosea psychrotolerans]
MRFGASPKMTRYDDSVPLSTHTRLTFQKVGKLASTPVSVLR